MDSSPFSTLSTELRLLIWEFALSTPIQISATHDPILEASKGASKFSRNSDTGNSYTSDISPLYSTALLRTCRQINDECSGLFWSCKSLRVTVLDSETIDDKANILKVILDKLGGQEILSQLEGVVVNFRMRYFDVDIGVLTSIAKRYKLKSLHCILVLTDRGDDEVFSKEVELDVSNVAKLEGCLGKEKDEIEKVASLLEQQDEGLREAMEGAVEMLGDIGFVLETDRWWRWENVMDSEDERELDDYERREYGKGFESESEDRGGGGRG